MKAPLKTKNFKADEAEKAQFTLVNEHFEAEVQRRNSKFLEVPLKKYGLIGFPLDHSFSPDYFRRKFKLEGLDNCSYDLFPMENINQFNQLLINKKDIVGLNVTVPYKETIVPFLDEIDATAKRIGAVNCIKINYTSKGCTTKGFNTDIIGFRKSIQPLLNHNLKGLILGNGGSAKAVKYVLDEAGIKYLVVARHNGDILFEQVDKKLLEQYQLLINTTPVGIYPNIEETLPIPYEFISNKHICFDLIYNPEKTMFLKKAEEKGATIKNGLEMLSIQAEKSWKIWNDKRYQ